LSRRLANSVGFGAIPADSGTRVAFVPAELAASSWAEWLTAIGTLLAVIVAVGLQGFLWFRERRRTPKLALNFDAHYFTREVAPDGSGFPYLRLAVSNGVGRRAATDAKILVLRVDEIGGGGVQRWLVNPALAWAHSIPQSSRLAIPAGATRYIDLGFWFDRSPPIKLTLCVVPQPNTGRNMLPAGRYEIELAATMTNGDASGWIADVSFEESLSGGLGEPKNVRASIRPA
jgi:hypothetical protein